MDYEKLLDEAYKKVKPVEKSEYSERFEIPKVESHIEGIRTIVSNFMQICSYLRRDCRHLLKYLQRGLASSGTIEGDRLILVKKVPSSRLNEKIKQYTEEFVICKECSKPDTELLKQGEFTFVHCLACGAKHSVSKI